MSHMLAYAKTKLETSFSLSAALSAALAMNTAALFALDSLGGIPQWIKLAARLFLQF